MSLYRLFIWTVFLGLGGGSLLHGLGCGIEPVQLLVASEANNHPDGGTETTNFPDGSEGFQEFTPTELTTPPDANCQPASTTEAKIWLSTKKNKAFLLLRAGAAQAFNKAVFTLPSTWSTDPDEVWSDKKGELGVCLRLPFQVSKSFPTQEIFVQVGSWCRRLTISSKAEKIKDKEIEAVSLPSIQEGKSTDMKLKMQGSTLKETYAFSSHPQIASIEDVNTNSGDEKNQIIVTVQGNKKGTFTLIVFDPSAQAFLVSTTVD
ncbi:MAG: hypothetical protein H6727_14550 [Myxococcales bacterium]|nr:hypothetical protein [Myxococcales bacterium]